MTKRFTAQVPTNILYEIGWSNPATWAEVFDYLSEKGVNICLRRAYSFSRECFTNDYEWAVNDTMVGLASSWEKAAEEAVMVCLEQLK